MVRLLGAEAGQTLLDVACGYGRHALVMAGIYGLGVTGVDIAPGLIERARRLAAEQELAIEFIVGHGRDLSWSERFDLALIAFNSFSLFSPRDAPQVLQAIGRALRPQGRLFLELDNRDFYRRFERMETGWFAWPGGLTLQEIYWHEALSVETNRDLIVADGSDQVEEFVLFKRLYDQTEIGAMLTSCGFTVDRIYGGWDLPPVAADQSKLLLVASKC